MNTNDLRATAIVMLSLGLAMVTGFLRQTTLAATLGASRATDIFLVAYALPEFVYVALPVILSPVIIPLFMQVNRTHGEATAWYSARRLGIRLLLGTLAITGFAAWSAPVILAWLSPGFDPAERTQALAVFYPMLPGLFLMAASTLVGTLLQVYRRFARPALTTAIYNLTFIAGLLALPFADPLSRAGLAVTLGALAAFLFQLPLLLSVRRQVSGTVSANKVELKPAFLMLGWMAVGYGIHHLILFVDRAMATGLGAGSVATLNFGYHLALAVGQVTGLAVSTVLFPALTEYIDASDLLAARRTLSRAMVLVLALALPAGLGVIVLRQPVVQVLLEYGAFTAEDTQAVGLSLAIYILAVIVDALCQPLWRLVYALKNGKIVLAVNGAQTLIRLIANFILIGYFGYNGLAISAVIGLVVQLLILIGLARRHLGWSITLPGWRWVAAITFAAGLSVLAVVALQARAAGLQPEPSPWLIIMFGGITLLVIYGGFLVGILRHPLLRKEGFFFGKD